MEDAAVRCAPTLPLDLAAAHAMIQQLIEQLKGAQRENTQLEHQLQQLLRRLYGRSSEKIDPAQQVLFAELLQQLQDQEDQQPTPAAIDTTAPSTPRPTSGNGHGRRKLPADLPREQKIIDLPEEDKPCPCCGKQRVCIGQEISEKLGYVPAKVKVIQTIRPRYACCDCDAQGNGAQIAIADLPPSAVEKGLADASLLSAVIVGKYSDHMPLNRLEKILA